METLLPHLALPEEGVLEIETLFTPSLEGRGQGEGESVARQHFQADSSGLSPPPNPPLSRGRALVLEIGFGGGEHLVAQAAQAPDARFLGVEPFLNGVASCLRHIEESNVQNVRLHMGDSRDVLARLPDASLNLCYILFPDPWPKARHHKRRLIQTGFIAELARTLKPGAEVRFATDWADYASWTLELFNRDRSFAWTAERAADWRTPWEGHTPTRYEQKRLGDCAPIWLSFVRSF